MKKPWIERAGDFLAGKGFYIVLFLCVAAIGISGYYLFSTMQPEEADAPVAGTAQVTVTPSPAPPEHAAAVRPEAPAVPSHTPRPTPAAVPSAPAAAAPASPSPAPSAAPAAAPVFTWPVRGEILTGYTTEALAYDRTMGDWRTHAGVDISAALGTQVLAAAAGTVTAVDQDDLMGAVVVIDHGSGLASSYANLAAVPAVAVGDTVSSGDVIGSVGQTAIAESALSGHLHFSITKDGAAADPLEYLPDQK